MSPVQNIQSSPHTIGIVLHIPTFTLKRMSKALQISRSGYYQWRKRLPSTRAKDNERLLEQIREVCDKRWLGRKLLKD